MYYLYCWFANEWCVYTCFICINVIQWYTHRQTNRFHSLNMSSEKKTHHLVPVSATVNGLWTSIKYMCMCWHGHTAVTICWMICLLVNKKREDNHMIDATRARFNWNKDVVTNSSSTINSILFIDGGYFADLQWPQAK